MLKLIIKDISIYGGIASIIGLILIFVTDIYSVVIALIFFVLMIILLTGRGLYLLNKFVNEENPDGYSKKSSFIRYETADGQNIKFETYRLIQCKRIIMNQLEYNFKWTGVRLPVINSSMQKVENIFERDTNNYDGAILKFKKPIKYNDTIVIHFRAEMNDVEKVSKPHVEVRVDSPIDIIHFRIILKYKTDKTNALLKRKRINTEVSASYENLESIPFDEDIKTFEHYLIQPESGYYYKIEWEK